MTDNTGHTAIFYQFFDNRILSLYYSPSWFCKKYIIKLSLCKFSDNLYKIFRETYYADLLYLSSELIFHLSDLNIRPRSRAGVSAASRDLMV